MSSTKRWTAVGQGQLQKWDEIGKTIEGVFQGTTPGKFGDLGLVDIAGADRVSFPIHTALVDKLKLIRVGAEVKIEYLGKRKSKTGTEYKDFNVFVGSAEDIQHDEPDKDVPF